MPITRLTPPTPAPVRTQSPSAPSARVGVEIAAPAAPVIDSVELSAASPVIKSLNALWDAGDYRAIVDAIDAEVAVMRRTNFAGLPGGALISAHVKAYVLEERLKATINRLSLVDDRPTKLRALALATDVATVCTAVFRAAVKAEAAATAQPVSAWVVAKDTHKKAEKWSPTEHLAYVAQKTVEFYLKGGADSQIRTVDADFLRSVKSGVLCEYVVDAYDVARAACVEHGRPSPGHTVLAQGNDALTAGTFEVQKNAKGEITQVLVGTFSGHFRTGLEDQVHIVRHLVLALSELFPQRSLAELTHMVVQREGQATNPRTIEVLARGIGLDGATAQRLEATLACEASRWQPLPASSVAASSLLAKELAGIKDWVVGAIKDELFIDPHARTTKPPRPGAATSALEVLARIDAFMSAATSKPDSVVGQQLIGALAAIQRYVNTLPAGTVHEPTQREVERLAARWNNGVVGATGADLGALFAPLPVASRRTRIVATVNPKATDVQLKDMLRAGMDVARFNTAHGSLDQKIEVMKKLRRFAAEMGRPITIQVDLEGPKLRLRTFENPKNLEANDIWLKPGQTATLTTKDVLGSQAKMLFPVDYPTMCQDVRVGDPVSMNDGTVEMVVKSIDRSAGTVSVEVTKGGKVWDNKGVAFPKSKLSGATVTQEDLDNLTALIDHVDLFAQSFVQSADDVVLLRERMNDLGRIKPIIAKIERGSIALDENELTKVALAADGLMVARGDLGVEVGEEQVPIAERLIREVGERTGRPVMLATEVMMSILHESRGSRGDVDALFGAIADRRFQAVMLGKETSSHSTPGDVIREVSDAIVVGEQEGERPAQRLVPALDKTTVAALFASRGALPVRTEKPELHLSRPEEKT
jgi:pyruvate kinase